MGASAIPINEAMKSAKMMKSICQIITTNNRKFGLGFFLNYSQSKKFLIITSYGTVPNELNTNDSIEIKGLKEETIKLNLRNRYIKYIPSHRNIIIIGIKESDKIEKSFEFLEYRITNERVQITLIKHPFENNSVSLKGNLYSIINRTEFKHDIYVRGDALGCPIVLLDNNMDIAEVIGIYIINNSTNSNGVFIEEIIKEIRKIKNKSEIKAEIYIEDRDINQGIRIINSYEEYMKKNYPNELIEHHNTNEEEIKKCQIEINNEIIPFSYFYKFPYNENYIIKYTFDNDLKKTNYMFLDCSHLSSIDLTKFNTKEVDNMSCMFANCCSLKEINLSNIDTEKVIDMGCMFYECSSLKEIDLSNFRTKNVINMGCMFKGCNSLEKIDLLNFDTKNVIDIGCMFKECSSLKEINLPNFITNNVTNMIGIFQDCKLLTDLNISGFNTEKTQNMNSIFKNCNSLKKIDLSSFDTKNVTDMNCMFYECNSLKRENIITQNMKIIQEFDVNIN